jgi:hypothetical protein
VVLLQTALSSKLGTFLGELRHHSSQPEIIVHQQQTGGNTPDETKNRDGPKMTHTPRDPLLSKLLSGLKESRNQDTTRSATYMPIADRPTPLSTPLSTTHHGAQAACSAISIAGAGLSGTGYDSLGDYLAVPSGISQSDSHSNSGRHIIWRMAVWEGYRHRNPQYQCSPWSGCSHDVCSGCCKDNVHQCKHCVHKQCTNKFLYFSNQ